MDIKDNTKNFEEQAQNFDDDYLGLLHINEYYPIPIKAYPEGSYQKRIFIVGKYVGSSFRIVATFLNVEETSNYMLEHKDLIYLIQRVTIARI